MLIPVIYQDANDVANVVKSVFGERIAGAQRSSSGGGRGGQPSPQDFFNALRGGGGRGGASQAAKSERTKISVAVDAKSNSLVVIATPQDFAEIQQLVEALDQSSMVTEETIITYAPSGKVNPDVLKAALESILGTQAKSTSESSSSSSSSNNNSSSPSTPSSSPRPEDIQRRIEFSDHDLAVAALVVQVVVRVVVSEEWVGDGPRLAAETPVEHLVVVAQAAVAQVVEDRC